MDRSARNCVHVNPNFKKTSGASEVAPHINPAFRGDRSVLLNHLKTMMNANLVPPVAQARPKILINPKILRNANVSGESSYETPSLNYLQNDGSLNSNVIGQSSLTVPIASCSRNKFSKINPANPNRGQIEINKEEKPPLTVPVVRKPNRSLVRNKPLQIVNRAKVLPSKENAWESLKQIKLAAIKSPATKFNKFKFTNSRKSTTPFKSPNKIRRSSKYKVTNSPDETFASASTSSIKTRPKIHPSNYSSKEIVYVEGEKYLFDGGAILKRLSRKRLDSNTSQSRKRVARISIRGMTFLRRSRGVFVAIDSASGASTLKKNNVTCPAFKRTGRCAAHERGRCGLVHDRRRVALCKRHLRGACDSAACPLSHDVVLEKMPVCEFYLNGRCARDDCPYLHVKHDDAAKVCCDFVAGFCARGVECPRLHAHVCPEFHERGRCEAKGCALPHRRAAARKIGLEKVAERSKECGSSKRKVAKNGPEMVSEEIGENPVVSDGSKRYYLDSAESSEDESPNIFVDVKNRPSVGSLPSFIAL